MVSQKYNNLLLLFLYLSLFFLSRNISSKIKTRKEPDILLENQKKVLEKNLKENALKKNQSEEEGQTGVYFKSESMQTSLKENYHLFKGNVLIKHQNILLETPKAKVFLNKKREITKIETTNPTHFLKKQTKDSEIVESFSKESFYYPIEKKITLIGKVKITREKDIIEGDIIHYNILNEELTGTKVSGFLSSINQKK